MTRPVEPTAAMLLMLADLGPKDEKPSSIKRCRKRMKRLKRNLGERRPPNVVAISHVESVRTEAIRTIDGRCLMCGLCVMRPSSGES
jgi:hypothetical protein